MPSNDFIVHPHAEVQGESVSATGALLSLIQRSPAPSPRLGKAASGADPYGACWSTGWASVWVAALEGGLC